MSKSIHKKYMINHIGPCNINNFFLIAILKTCQLIF